MGEIFIIDDDPSVRAALSIVLGAEGFATTGFPDGESFLAAAPSRAPGCVLIDVHLPGCSGLDLLKKLDPPRYPAPILVISGLGEPDSGRSNPPRRARLHRKPFDPAMVVTRVREAMAAWRNGDREAAPGETLLPLDFPGHERPDRA